MKRFLLPLLVFVLLPTVAAAQWTYEGAFPDETFLGSTHGLAVDAEGKLWVTNYFNTERLVRAPGDTINTRAIYVFNPDGTEVDFSPIQMITVGGVTDTLTMPNLGLESDHEGNILASVGQAAPVFTSYLYRINHQTGEGMNRADLSLEGEANPSPTAAAVTDDGNIIVTYVFGGNPIIILDPDFNVIGNVTNAKPGFSRTIEVSPDGQDVYHTGYTNNAVYRYHSDDGVFGEYELVDTLLLAGMAVESAEFNPATGYLWVSAGSYLNLPNQHPTVETGYTPGTWYAYDTESGEIVDSLSWQFTTPGDPNERPRAIAFSPDGNTAYVGAFGTNAVPAVQKFTRADDTAIEPIGGVPEAIALSQNYPNPFNPVTQITFGLKQTGHVSIKVFDTLGRQVAVLADEVMTAGTYEVDFDGRNLPSGTYLYVMSTGGQKMSRMMVLLK